MPRFIRTLIFFTALFVYSNAQAVNVSPPYYTYLIVNVTPIPLFTSVSALCADSVSTSNAAQAGTGYYGTFLNVSASGGCRVENFRQYGAQLINLGITDTLAARSYWDNCLWVDGITETCQETYPNDFNTYVCNTEINENQAGNTLNVCIQPPPCVGLNGCYSYDYLQQSCASKLALATNDPFTDYVELPYSYTDDYTHSLSCTNVSSDRTVDPNDATPLNFTPDQLTLPTPTSGGGGGGTADPTGGGGGGGSGSGGGIGGGSGTGSGSNDGTGQTIDDSNIVNSIDNQTSMINSQLNTINGNIVDGNNNTLAGINAQTTMLNTQLNNLGQTIADTDNDVAILTALNNQIQTTEDVIDAVNDININANVTFPDNEVITDDPALSNIDKIAHEQAMSNYQTRLNNAPIVTSLNNITSSIVFATGTCAPFSINLTGTLINKIVSTTIMCDLAVSTQPIVSPVMLVIFSFIAFRVFASA